MSDVHPLLSKENPVCVHDWTYWIAADAWFCTKCQWLIDHTELVEQHDEGSCLTSSH